MNRNSLEDTVDKEQKRILDLVQKSNVSPKELAVLLKGAKVPRVKKTNARVPKQTVTYGVISDSHIGSVFYNEAAMDQAAAEFNRRKVDFVIHGGDILEGHYENRRQGSVFELSEVGGDAQVKRAVQELSKINKKIPIYFITGNHEQNTFYKLAGFDVGTQIEEKLPNAHYLGNADGTIELPFKRKIQMLHPDGGSSYAISYRSQKIAESLEGGTKPDILHLGHFHKAEYLFYRNIHIMQNGCFRAKVGITTKQGLKPIEKIKVGDEVLTHLNRFRKVSKLFKRKYKGDFYKLNFGRKNSLRSTLTATEEHPVLVERGGIRQWLEIKNVLPGDRVFVLPTECEVCGGKIPYYNKLCNKCNPMDKKDVLLKLSKTKGGFKKKLNNGSGWKHLQEDIIPFCDELNTKGWKAIPVGAGVIPDIVAFKDGKVCLFEVESSSGLHLERKKGKYEGKEIMDYIDEVKWIDIRKRKNHNSNQNDYEFDEISGFIKLEVLSNEVEEKKKKSFTVYNFEVEEDNSYIASNVVVHNCLEHQTSFMKGRHLSAHMGYWVVTADVTKDGVKKIVPEFFPVYK